VTDCKFFSKLKFVGENSFKKGEKYVFWQSILCRYLENLIDYMDTVAEILGQDAAYNQVLWWS
jgi:hypothetical protein